MKEGTTDRVGEIMDRKLAPSREGESVRQDRARSHRPRAKSRKRQAMGR